MKFRVTVFPRFKVKYKFHFFSQIMFRLVVYHSVLVSAATLSNITNIKMSRDSPIMNCQKCRGTLNVNIVLSNIKFPRRN